MLKVGLTGGTGAGKTTVAARLATRGAVVIDADALAREVLAPGSEGLVAVVEAFGPAVLDRNGALDRAALASVVFVDEGRRRELEGITHPRIAARTAQLLATAPPNAVVVHDVPLLVEKRMGALYHLVVVVTAPTRTRVARLVGSRGMPEGDALARISAQASDDDRRAAADVLLSNTGVLDDVHTAVDRLWGERLVPFENNLRSRRPVRPDRALVVAPDPSWPAQARRIADRLQAVAREDGVAVEHVGPTAVSGQAAPDVIQLLVLAPSTDRVPAVVDRLAGAGFVPAHHASGHHGAVLHGCDPGRPAEVLVTASGDGREHELLVRDWLRAHPAAQSTADGAGRTAVPPA